MNPRFGILTFSLLAATFASSIAGCGQPPTNEPKKLQKLVDDGPAEPIAQVKPAVERKPTAPRPSVEQAAFADESSAAPATVPQVLLTDQHAALARVKVGDSLPAIELPKVLGGTAKLSAL